MQTSNIPISISDPEDPFLLFSPPTFFWGFEEFVTVQTD